MSAEESTPTQAPPYGPGPFGIVVAASEYAPLRDLIGEVEQSQAGNTVLRVGRETAPGGSWTQTGHIVLVPDERERFIDALVAQRGESAGQVQPRPVSFDQEAAVRWLRERHPDASVDNPYTRADYLDIDADWPGNGSDGQIDNVFALIEAALDADVIFIGGLDVELVRTADQYGVLSGFRIITIQAGVDVASASMWARDLTGDAGGEAGALAALRNATDVIAGLVSSYDKR